MTLRPKLSLLIPAFNAAWCLPRLLESAHAQTEPFDEIWIYDDCSADDTAEVAEKYGAKVLRGDINRGCSAGKNALAHHVSTDWIHFHDADDELLPNFVERARIWIDRNDRDVVLFPFEYRDNETKELLLINRFDRPALEQDARRYAISHQINPFCGLYRRSALLDAGGYDEDPAVLYNEDVAFHIKMAFAGLRFSADEEIALINYRVGGSMSSTNQSRCAVAHANVLFKTMRLPGAAPYRREIGTKLWLIAGVLASLGEDATSRLAADAAAKLLPPPPSAGQPWFQVIARFHPYGAIALRERAIRLFKGHLRSPK